ncbi:MAG: MmgE/PrpD family protein [Pseudomonadota bacterium]
MDDTTRRIVRFARAIEYRHLPVAAIRAAKARVLDSLGVGLAAYMAPPVRIARRVAPAVADPAWSARIWGSGARTSPDMAAFVNGTMVRYLDLNDAYRTLDASHPSDNLPGLLAVVEALGLSGRDFILALVISYEIQCRFTDTVPFNDAGWDQPLVGAMACALAAGRVMGLDEERMGHALSLAVIPHLPTYQTRAGELSMWKGCAGPNGARHGVFAATLAKEGMTGPTNAFEGVFGIWKQTLGQPAEFALPEPGSGPTLGIVQTNIKKYPVRDSCQLPIDTALELRARIEPSRIAKLHVETYKSAYAGAVADAELWRPQTRETADHSMPFSIAAALADGEVSADSFELARFRDADVLRLIGAMTVDINPEFSKATPGVRNCRITASAADGAHVAAHRQLTAAEIERGTPDDALEAKFHRLTRPFLPEDVRREMIERVSRLDQLARVDGIVDLTVF